MRFLLVLACLPQLASAAGWVQFRSGPFEVYTDAGSRAGRLVLIQFEQFRHSLGQVLGSQDLDLHPPVRIVVVGKQRPGLGRLSPGRDRYVVLLHADAPVPPPVFKELTTLLLKTNTARMPEPVEKGLADLFATIEIERTSIVLGKPPASPERTPDWARMHLLATSADYYGKLRVLLGNLRNGVPPDVAYRNSVGKTAAQIDQEATRYLAAGNFAAVNLSGRALAERDFLERDLTADQARLAIADALSAKESRAAYEAMLRENIHVVEAHEGLGLLDLWDGRREEAVNHLGAAVEAGTKSPRAYLEYGRLARDNAKARQALEQALKLNPKLDEAHLLLAQREANPEKKIGHLKAATTLNPRDAGAWQALAEISLDQKDFAGAAKAWRAGEQAATSAAQREHMRQAWLSIEKKRLDYEEAERKRVAAEKQREIEQLKEKARAELRALEARVNQGREAGKPGETVVPWWDGPKPQGRVRGALKQIDCLGGRARLVVQSDEGKTVKLLLNDPSQITIMGGGESTLGCGPQKGRRVSIEYFPKPNSKLATAGEVATLEFQ